MAEAQIRGLAKKQSKIFIGQQVELGHLFEVTKYCKKKNLQLIFGSEGNEHHTILGSIWVSIFLRIKRWGSISIIRNMYSALCDK